MLQEQDKLKLDGIVQQMTANKESDSNIQLVVNDFKQKYSNQAQPAEPAKQGVVGTLLSPLKEGVQGLATLYGGGEQGIANKLKSDVQAGAQDIQQGNVLKGVVKSGLRTAGDVAGTIYAPIGAALQATGVNKVFDYLGELSQKGGKYNPINLITDSKSVQDFVAARPNLEEDFGRALNLAFAKAETGKIDPKTVVNRTITQFENGVAKAKAIPGQVATKTNSVLGRLPEDIINKRVQELDAISNNYSKLRKIRDFSPDENTASLKRIASTDVLSGSVDDAGTIITKGENGAVQKYKAQTLDHAENVVKKNLERLGEKVSLDEVKIRLEDAVINSGLEGSELKIALKKINRELEGYKLKANPDGTVPLSLLQDAKVAKYKVTNFQTLPEVQAYNKAIGKGLKNTIEKNTSFNVKEVNGELSKYLQDIKLLESLDGKKVKGGKLGKYFAQISGNIVGGAIGSAVGGPIGSGLGTIVGGELGSRIKGNTLSKTFGRETGSVLPKNQILETASQRGNSPRLALPAPTKGSPQTRLGSGPTIELPGSKTYSNNLGNLKTSQSTPTIKTNTVIPESIPQKNTTVKTPESHNRSVSKEISNHLGLDEKYIYENATKNKVDMEKYLNKLDKTTDPIERKIIGDKLIKEITPKRSILDMLKSQKGSVSVKNPFFKESGTVAKVAKTVAGLKDANLIAKEMLKIGLSKDFIRNTALRLRDIKDTKFISELFSQELSKKPVPFNLKLTDELKTKIESTLMSIKPDKVTTVIRNGKPSALIDTSSNSRLLELQQKLEAKGLSTNDYNELLGILKNEGIDVASELLNPVNKNKIMDPLRDNIGRFSRNKSK